MNYTERFLNYVSYDTTSSETSETYPTTARQLALAKVLAKELKELGIKDVLLGEDGLVYAKLEGNTKSGKIIAYIAHMDTSPDASGENVKARIIKNYDGTKITLNHDTFLDPLDFPNLLDCKNDDLIVTDGTTLLGADDKSGIAIIMTFIEKVIKENIKHNDIYIVFTPDEEVGKGTDNFDREKCPAEIAYTVDGGDVDILAYENFNAATATIDFKGFSIHPGSAKNKMINAARLAVEFDTLLSEFDRPEHTEGYEGFNHLHYMEGDVESAKMVYIIRNHDKALLENQKESFNNIVSFLNKKYAKKLVTIEIENSYSNMYEILKDNPFVIDLATKAITAIQGHCNPEAIRGGTDGAALTFKGLPCPNLGTGGYNYHGCHEYLNINQAESMILVLEKINELNIQ